MNRLLVILSFSLAILAARGETLRAGVEFADTVMSLPQVSVTSLKIGSQLRSKPVSATVIGASQLQRDGVVNMHQISDLVPNFYMPRYGSRITSSIYVRGIGARIDQPAVGLSIDNIPILNKDNYDFDLDDMVKVDMIRGPQSSMYGRNTMCGLINISTLSPLQYEGVRVSVGGGCHGLFRSSAGIYKRLNSKVGVAVGGLVGGSNGYYRNTFNGSRVGTERQLNAWYKVTWQPVQQWRVENTGRAYKSRQSGYPYESLASGVIAYNDTCFYKRTSWLDGLTISWSRDRWSVTSATSIQHIDDNMTLDQDFLPASYFTLEQRRRETSVTQDFIVKHDGDRYDWLAGVFLFTRHTSMRAPVTFKPDGITHLIENKRNEINPLYPISWDEDNFVLNSDFNHPTRGLGIYHSSTYRVGAFTLVGTLRMEIEQPRLRFHSHTNTKYTIYNHTDPANETVYRHETVKIDETDRLSHTYVQLLPKLAVMYSLPTGQGNVYASFAKGYKPGGYNTQMFSDFLQQKLMGTMGLSELYNVDEIIGYKPERSYNYELGTHLTLLQGKMSVDASAFYIDCRDQQLTRFPDGTTTGRVMDNAGRTRSLGMELAMEYNVLPHWVINASWGYADARFVDYSDGINDYADKHVPYAPLNTLYGSLRYETSLPSCKIDRLEVQASVHGTGSIYWNEANTARQSFYAPLQVSASVTSGMFTLRLWADNINNVKFNTFYFKSMGNEFVQRGAPFTCGATLSMNIDMQ